MDADGNVTFSGVAPEAQLAIFKVFSDNQQGAYSEDILAGVNDAVMLDVDVINMSLGQSSGFTDEQNTLTDWVYSMVSEAGIMLCISAGNSNTSSYYGIQGDLASTSNPDNGIVGSPSTYDPGLSVASVNATATPAFEAASSEISYNSVSEHDFASELLNGKDSVELEYVVIPGLGEKKDYEGLDVKGKVALVQRGVTNFNDKQLNAAEAGAVACLIYNNKDGYLLNMQVDDYTIPTASISLASGKKMAQAENKTLRVAKDIAGHVTMSDFSSWGPTSSLELKPEVTAPGSNIYSSLPYNNAYGYMSGTSMASPYLAGAAAALKQMLDAQYPSMEQADRKILEDRILMSTASVLADEENESLPYSPRRQGAGLVDLNAAMNMPAYLYVRGQERPKIELGDDPQETGMYDLSFHVKNMTSVPVTYEIHTSALTEAITEDGRFMAQRERTLDADVSNVTVSNGNLYVLPLGNYLLQLPDGVEAPAPSLDKIAISGGWNANIHTLYPVYAGMLRGAGNVNVTITDRDTDEVYVDWDIANARKCYFSATLTLDDAEAIAKIRAAYDALSTEQKTLVSNLDVLEAAEAKLKALAAGWENPYRDVDEDDWYYNAVKFVTQQGLMVGVASTNSAPTPP